MHSSTPIKRDSSSATTLLGHSATTNGAGAYAIGPAELEAKLENMQRNLSQLALDNEVLEYEMAKLRAENEQLARTIQEREVLHNKTLQQLKTVVKTAIDLCTRVRGYKCRHYRDNPIGFAYDD